MVKDFRLIDYNNMNDIIDSMQKYVFSHYESIKMLWYHVIDLDVEKFDMDDVDDDLTIAEDEIYNNIMDYSHKIENINSRNMFSNILNLYSEAVYHSTKKDIFKKYYLRVASINTKGGSK